MADDVACDLWYVERLGAVGTDKAQVDSGRRLKLHLKELVANIGKLPVILVAGVTQCLTNQSVKCSASMALT